MDDETPLYKKTQFGTVAFSVLAALALIAFTLGFQRGSSPVAAVLAALLFLALAIAVSTLTISVTATTVEWWLSFRLFPQRIALADIDLVATKRLGVLSLFGIRVGSRNTRWVVSGRDAIELVGADGSRTILGTADPNGAFAAISSIIDAKT